MIRTVTKIRVLSEMLLYYENQARMVSKNLAKLEAVDGFERVFDGFEERCQVIREIMRDIESGKNAGNISNAKQETKKWQQDVYMYQGPAPRMEL